MPIFPTWYTQKSSPVLADKILISDSESSNQTKYMEITNLPFPAVEEAKFSFKTFVTVWFSNADYICDGTDDDVQIQEAIDAITNGTIFIKKWTYQISASLIITKDNISLLWEKWTILKLKDSGNTFILELWDASTLNSNITIDSIEFDWNKSNNTSSYGISFKEVNYVNVTNCYLHDFKNQALLIPNVSNFCTVTKNIFLDNDSSSIHSYTWWSQNNTFTENSIINSWLRDWSSTWGIYIPSSCDGNIISNNQIYNCGAWGIEIWHTESDSWRNIVEWNSIKWSYGFWIQAYRQNDSIISNNLCYNNWYSWIYLIQAENCIVEWNKVLANVNSGIWLYNSDNCSITNNYINFNYQNWILLEDCQYWNFNWNFILDNSQELDTTYDEVQLKWIWANYSIYNHFSWNYIKSDISTNARYWINEVDSNQDYNRYINNTINVTGLGSANFNINWANSTRSHNSDDEAMHSFVRTNAGATYAPATWAQTVTLDCSSNSMHIVTWHASGTAITFAITWATNNQQFFVSILQWAVVSTITWWFATVRWAWWVVPTLTATVWKRDTFSFIRTWTNTYDWFIVWQNC